jgi:hypothetical protein
MFSMFPLKVVPHILDLYPVYLVCCHNNLVIVEFSLFLLEQLGYSG